MHRSRVPMVPMAVQWTLLGTLLWAVVAGPAGSGGSGWSARSAGTLVAGIGGALACAGGGWVLLARAMARHGRRGLGPADHVTVTRGTLACVVVALTTTSLLDLAGHAASGGAAHDTAGHDTGTASLVVVATVALVLDALDGWVARRTRTASELGARLDMEVDAFLILVLSVAASRVLGWWVLAIGLFRYLLAAATWAAPWLGGSVPARSWRKAVAALQGIVLTVVTAQVLPRPLAAGVVGLALVLLAWSFGTQGAELWQARVRARARTHPRAPVDAARRQRVRVAP